ncbi:unnamed protein product [Paramecium primaurelia]|uniref:Uncharacterized protein n=1 Tax=Paramecium primaurelia TaxID=5886 RepID=A0A8S1KBC5_PARPR|nr:unnamed protein product [Paramecium primaurelia]
MNSLPEILDQLTIFYVRDRIIHFKENHDFLFNNQIRGLKYVQVQAAIYLAVFIDLNVLQVKNDTKNYLKNLIQFNLEQHQLVFRSQYGYLSYQRCLY